MAVSFNYDKFVANLSTLASLAKNPSSVLHFNRKSHDIVVETSIWDTTKVKVSNFFGYFVNNGYTQDIKELGLIIQDQCDDFDKAEKQLIKEQRVKINQLMGEAVHGLCNYRDTNPKVDEKLIQNGISQLYFYSGSTYGPDVRPRIQEENK